MSRRDLPEWRHDKPPSASKLNRLTGMVEDGNQAALRLDYKIGFEHEFTMRKAGNNGQDLHVLVLWPENFRYRSLL